MIGPAQAGTGAGRSARIVPSVLPADFARLGEECQALEAAGVDGIQWDVMDGHFVPNLTFGADVIGANRKLVDIPFEAHLMVADPDQWIEPMLGAGASTLIVHAEACRHLHRTLGTIRSAGAATGVALNPATPLDQVVHVLDLVDLVLVMTVNPGFGGQRYIAGMEPKIAQARRMIDQSGYEIALEVDGGIGPKTIAGAAAAGADVFCAGSSLFGHPDGQRAAVRELRALAEEAKS